MITSMHIQAKSLTDIGSLAASLLQRGSAGWRVEEHMPVVDRAYNKVRLLGINDDHSSLT